MDPGKIYEKIVSSIEKKLFEKLALNSEIGTAGPKFCKHRKLITMSFSVFLCFIFSLSLWLCLYCLYVYVVSGNQAEYDGCLLYT